MKQQLKPLTFGVSDLAPVISAHAIELHYGQHLTTYINKYNEIVSGTELENISLEAIIKSSDGVVYNNAAQIWNHNFFFEQLSATGSKSPVGKLANMLENEFDSFELFKHDFVEAALSIFGSGWIWLVKMPNGCVEIVKESNAGNPLTRGMKPLFVIDVWEHAYYVDYENRRSEYLNAIWNVINWNVVEQRL